MKGIFSINPSSYRLINCWFYYCSTRIKSADHRKPQLRQQFYYNLFVNGIKLILLESKTFDRNNSWFISPFYYTVDSDLICRIGGGYVFWIRC